MKKIISALLLFSLLLSFTQCNTHTKSDKQYLLKMRLAKGDKFSQNTTMDVEMDFMNMKMKMEMYADFEVLDSTPAGKELKMTYRKSNFKMDMGGIGGDKKSDSLLNRSNSKIEGKSVILVFSDNKVTDVKGFEAVRDTSNTDSVMNQELKKMFSKENLNSMFGTLFSLYPNKMVREGDSWTAENNMDIMGTIMAVKNKYTFLNVQDGIAEIAIEGTINTNGQVMTGGAKKIDMEMDGLLNGKMYIKLSDGYLKNGNYDMKVDAKVGMMGQKMPVKIKATCTFKG